MAFITKKTTYTRPVDPSRPARDYDVVQSGPFKGKAKKQGGGKKPSDYQLFMKKQIPIYKKKNPKKSHREAFSAVAKLWKKQKN